MIDSIIKFLETCPYVSTYILTAEFLGDKDGHIGIFLRSAEPVLERYADGGVLKQFVFCLSCRSSNHEKKSESVMKLFEHVADWLESADVLPALSKGCTAQRFEVLKNGAMAERHYGTNRYDMECRLVYYAEKGSET